MYACSKHNSPVGVLLELISTRVYIYVLEMQQYINISPYYDMLPYQYTFKSY